MTGFVRKALPVAAGLLLVATSAMAGLPDATTSTVPAVMVGSCSATISEDTYIVVVRDINSAPVAGATVTIDLSTATGVSGNALPVHLHQSQIAPTTFDCPTQTMSQVSDGSGTATFQGIFGGAENTASVQVSANGVPLLLIEIRSTDLDALGDTDSADLNRFRQNFFFTPAATETDYKAPAGTGSEDLNVFRVEFFSGVVVTPC